MGAKFDYMIRDWRYLSENNYDILVPIDGPKGSGKSYTAVAIAKRYIEIYGFVCPHCGTEFFKNVWERVFDKNGNIVTNADNVPIFRINKDIEQGYKLVNGKKKRVMIECPLDYDTDLNTGEKKIRMGCGHRFFFKERKIPKWDARKYIAYDNKDVMNKIYTVPKYTPIVCVTGDTKIAVKYDNDIETFKKVKELVGKNNFKILSYNYKKEIYEYKKPEKCIFNGKQEVYDIELYDGKKITTTGDHLFLLQNGSYKRADKLTDKDEVVIYSEKM